MKIKLLSLVLLSSFAATTNAADKSDDSSSSSSTTGAASLQRKTRNTPNSPLGKLATGGESGAVKSGGRFAALVFGGANPASSLAQSMPLPSSKTATTFDPFGTLTVESKVNNLSTTLGTSTSTIPATVTTSSTTAATANTTKSSTASKLAASGVLGDDDDDSNDLVGKSKSNLVPQEATIAKPEHDKVLQLLKEQFTKAKEQATSQYKLRIKDLSDKLNEMTNRAQNEESSKWAFSKENDDLKLKIDLKDTQLRTLQGLHDAQVAEVKRLLGVVDSKEQELATLKANAAQGSSAVDATTISDLKDDLAKANKALDIAKEALKTLQDEKVTLSAELAKLNAQIADQAVALTELAKVKADLTTANSRVADAERLKDEAEAAKGKVDGELAAAKGQVADAERLKDEAVAAKGKVDQKLVNLEAEVATLRATNGDLDRQNKEAAVTIANHTAAFKKLDDDTAAEIDALQAGQGRFLAQLQDAVFGEALRTAQAMTGNPIDKDDSAMVGSILSSNPFFINLMANPFIARLLQESEEPNNSPAPMATHTPAAVTAGNAAATSTSSVTTLPTVNAGENAATTTTTSTTSAKSPTLGNDSDDEGAATTVTQGGNNSQKPNQAGNGNGGRGGKIKNNRRGK